MQALLINATNRNTTALNNLLDTSINDNAQILVKLEATKLSMLTLSDGSKLYFDESHLELSSCAFTLEDNGNLHVIFGKAIYIPYVQDIKSNSWKYDLDPYLKFYTPKFSGQIRIRITENKAPIQLDEICLGRPIRRKSMGDLKREVGAQKFGIKFRSTYNKRFGFTKWFKI